jgi:hypothetical protein
MEKKFDLLDKAEAHNLKESTKFFPSEMVFAERLWALYEIPEGECPVELGTPVGFFMESRNALLLSVLSILRCHNAQALSNLRFATECASYAYKTKDLEKASLWVAGKKNKNFKKEFRDNRFSDDHVLIKQLKETWVFASEFSSHATLPSVMGHQKQTAPNKTNFDFFDVLEKEHINDRRRFFWLILSTHFQILEVFAEVFETYLSDNWSNTLLDLKEDLRTYHAEIYCQRLKESH